MCIHVHVIAVNSNLFYMQQMKSSLQADWGDWETWTERESDGQSERDKQTEIKTMIQVLTDI